MKSMIIKTLIEQYSSMSKNTPFLQHIDYFKNDDESISALSISKKWHKLTGENRIETFAKGVGIIQSANKSTESKGCPYRFSFKSSTELMPCLKHSRDTGIVNKDGSINLETLEYILTNFFQEDDHHKLVITRSKMYEYLEECDKRDKNLPATGVFFVPYKILAKGEWDTFFDTFGDVKIGDEIGVTVDTFLLFYFNSDTLYERKLNQSNK